VSCAGAIGSAVLRKQHVTGVPASRAGMRETPIETYRWQKLYTLCAIRQRTSVSYQCACKFWRRFCQVRFGRNKSFEAVVISKEWMWIASSTGRNT